MHACPPPSTPPRYFITPAALPIYSVVRVRRVLLPLHDELLPRMLPGRHGVSIATALRAHIVVAFLCFWLDLYFLASHIFCFNLLPSGKPDRGSQSKPLPSGALCFLADYHRIAPISTLLGTLSPAWPWIASCHRHE